MPEDLQGYLDDILRFSTECQAFLEGKSNLAYSNDPKLRRAVERSLQIVGEAVWQAIKLSSSFRVLYLTPQRSSVSGIDSFTTIEQSQMESSTASCKRICLDCKRKSETY